MKLKFFVNAMLAGALLAVAPVWAHGDYDHGHWKRWERHHRHYQHPHSAYRERVVVREYVERAPVYRDYPVSAPAPGVHIVTPDIFIPWPR